MRKIKYSVIYKIENIINGKIYIGSAIDYDLRKRNHISTLNRNIHRNMHLQNAWNMYGKENFNFDIIEEVFIKENESREEFRKRLVEDREQYYLDNILFANQNNNKFYELGYNINRKATSRLGAILTEETIIKLIESHKGKKLSNETKSKMRESHLGNKNHFYGKTHTKESREKISNGLKGKKIPESVRNKISQSHFRKVKQFNLVKNIIRYWNSREEILNTLLLTEKLTISNKHEVLSNGYYWSYEDDKIVQYELTKIFLKEYTNLKEAGIENNIPYQHISAVCNGKRNKTFGNYYWEY